MESVIKWETGNPKEEGEYLVQLKYGHIRIINWEKFNDYYNWTAFSREIIAWFRLRDIKPYYPKNDTP